MGGTFLLLKTLNLPPPPRPRAHQLRSTVCTWTRAHTCTHREPPSLLLQLPQVLQPPALMVPCTPTERRPLPRFNRYKGLTAARTSGTLHRLALDPGTHTHRAPPSRKLQLLQRPYGRSTLDPGPGTHPQSAARSNTTPATQDIQPPAPLFLFCAACPWTRAHTPAERRPLSCSPAPARFARSSLVPQWSPVLNCWHDLLLIKTRYMAKKDLEPKNGHFGDL